MLSDLAVWTNWDLMFEQELGQLPDFVQQTGLLSCCFVPTKYQQALHVCTLA